MRETLEEIKKGQRWVLKPESSSHAIMIEVVKIIQSNVIECIVLQIWQYTTKSSYNLNQTYQFGFSSPYWSYELLQGQDAP